MEGLEHQDIRDITEADILKKEKVVHIPRPRKIPEGSQKSAWMTVH